MYLENVNIDGFRLFTDFNLELNRGMNIIVGENDSGKTALLDAIRYTLGTNSHEATYFRETDFTTGNKKLSIELKFNNVAKHAHVFVEHLTYETKDDKTTPVLYIHLSAEQTGKERRGFPLITTEVRSGKGGSGPKIEYEIRDFLATTYLKPLRDAEAELSPGRGSRLSQVLLSSSELKTESNIESILSCIANANSQLIQNGAPISDAAKRIEDDFLHNLIFKEDKKKILANIDIAGIKDEEISKLNSTDKKRYLKKVLEGLNLSLNSSGLTNGLGYNNILFMATELLLLEQEKNNEFSLLLIEEPEAHLHPQLQIKLLDFLLNQTKDDDSTDDRIQCLITTHSPNISSKASPNNIIMMNSGKAHALRKYETELGETDYIFLQKFLDATKANLFFARAVFLVEGDSELILLPTIAKILGYSFEDYGVSLIKYDNSGSWKRFVKIFLRTGADVDQNFWNPIKVAVTRDLDLWPSSAEINTNDYGFLTKKQPSAQGQGGNLKYWLSEYSSESITEYRENLKTEKRDNKVISLERQNIKVFVADHWTFEFCLARCGLYEECLEALGVSEELTSEISEYADKTASTEMTAEEIKATYIQSKVSKTDFAYNLSSIIEKKYTANPTELLGKLPNYIVDALKYVANISE